MIALTGTYADDCNGPLPDRKLEYVCRVFLRNGNYLNGIGEPVIVGDGDALLVCGRGTWFALYRAAGARSINAPTAEEKYNEPSSATRETKL